jgi:hypothetical protein
VRVRVGTRGRGEGAPAGVEHVAHERRGRGGARGVEDVGDDGGERARDGVGDDRAGRGPGEDLDLAGRVEEDMSGGRARLSGGRERWWYMAYWTESARFSTRSRT